MEAEKFYAGLYVSWRPWGISRVAQSKSESLTTREADGVTHSLRPKA